MRKYKTLLLFVTSVVSLSLLIVYRNEYNRLHYVLEVFDFFGHSCNFSEVLNSKLIVQQHDWGPMPSWQQNEEFYIYSAFLLKYKREAKAIVLQSSQEANNGKSCYLWFDDDDKPIMGKFRYKFIDGNPSHKKWIYYYYCAFSSRKLPHAVSFVSRKNRNKLVLMKQTLLDSPITTKNITNITVCIAPTQFSKRLLLEFISFHKLIGIENFIFYLHGIPHSVSKLILMLSSKLGIETTFYTWNYPFVESNLSRLIVEKDCLSRTFEKTENVVVLEIDEFLVPSRSQSLPKTLSIYNLKQKNGRLSLPVQKICRDNESKHLPIIIQNFQVVNDNSTNVCYLYKSTNDEIAFVTQMIEDTASIHKYVKCNESIKKINDERSILRFKKDLIRSTLVQLSLHDQL